MKTLLLLVVVGIECGWSPALVAQTQQGPLVFTEYSSTSLTATMGGADFGTIRLLQPDLWAWFVPTDIVWKWPFIKTSRQYWVEPENPALGNAISWDFTEGRVLIQSDRDMSFEPDAPRVPNGTIEPGFLGVIHPSSPGPPVVWDVQFIDYGDTTTVPDRGTSVLLLGLGCTVLGLFAKVFIPASRSQLSRSPG